jgi:hypothetical protein
MATKYVLFYTSADDVVTKAPPRSSRATTRS